MKTQPWLAALSAAVLLCTAGTAMRAENNDDMSCSGMFKQDRID